MLRKKYKPEILHLEINGVIKLWKLKVYHPILFSVLHELISKNPEKLGAIQYNPDDGKFMNIRFTPKGKRIKVAEFETEEECKQFYDIISSVVRKESKMEFSYKL